MPTGIPIVRTLWFSNVSARKNSRVIRIQIVLELTLDAKQRKGAGENHSNESVGGQRTGSVSWILFSASVCVCVFRWMFELGMAYSIDEEGHDRVECKEKTIFMSGMLA